MRLMMVLILGLFLSACSRIDAVYSCHGSMEHGLLRTEGMNEKTDVVNVNITMTLKKDEVVLGGDESQYEFVSKGYLLESHDQNILRFGSDPYEDFNKRSIRLRQVFMNQKDLERYLSFEKNHYSTGEFNKEKNALSLAAYDNHCYKNQRNGKGYCGLYSKGDLKCEQVRSAG